MDTGSAAAVETEAKAMGSGSRNARSSFPSGWRAHSRSSMAWTPPTCATVAIRQTVAYQSSVPRMSRPDRPTTAARIANTPAGASRTTQWTMRYRTSFTACRTSMSGFTRSAPSAFTATPNRIARKSTWRTSASAKAPTMFVGTMLTRMSMMDRACPGAAPPAWSAPPRATMSTPRPGPSHTAIPMPSASATDRVLRL